VFLYEERTRCLLQIRDDLFLYLKKMCCDIVIDGIHIQITLEKSYFLLTM